MSTFILLYYVHSGISVCVVCGICGTCGSACGGTCGFYGTYTCGGLTCWIYGSGCSCLVQSIKWVSSFFYIKIKSSVSTILTLPDK